MELSVKLKVFEGPLDLLLHLIDKNKVNIYDIPIVEITNQYMAYIREMQRQDLNIMSEFLVMAATLLNIKARMLLPAEVNEEGEEEDPRQELVEKLLDGMDIAVITDAGTPGISDPGEELVRMCYEAGVRVSSVPGPAACVTALTMSGLGTRRFAFEAFLPADKKEREAVLTELETETRTIVMYEAPHRLVKTLKLLSERLGVRRITVCRELTKKHETAFLTTIPEAVAYYEANDPKGECVLVIEGRSREEMRQEEQARWEEMSIEEHMEHYLAQGMNRKDAMKQTAKDRGMQKREVYNYLEKIKE